MTNSEGLVLQMFRRRFFISRSGFLARDFLPKIERCLEHLTDEDVWWRPNEASNSIGNLLLHLCGNVTQWIIGRSRRPDARAAAATGIR